MSGQRMQAEMDEQSEVLRGLLERRADTVGGVRAAAPSTLNGVLLLARGSSDNAALHARYLMEMCTSRPAALAAPSLWTRYGATTALAGWVVVAVSQSGRTPEIVDAADRMRSAGARVVSVTNGEDSDLAAISDFVVALRAGEEIAVPATKTVTGSLLALTHVAAGLGEVGWTPDDERRLPDHVATVLEQRDEVAEVVAHLEGRETVHVGRGYTLPVALESALKFKETTTRPARGYASGDFLHGPVAAVGPSSAVVAYAAAGPTHDDVVEVLTRLRGSGVRSFLVSDTVPGGSEDALATPPGLPEPLAAIPLTVRAQQLAHQATLSAGLDPDRPAGLNKVTITH